MIGATSCTAVPDLPCGIASHLSLERSERKSLGDHLAKSKTTAPESPAGRYRVPSGRSGQLPGSQYHRVCPYWCPFRCSVGSAWPSVTIMHGRLDLPGLSEVLRQFPRASFVSISDHKRLPLPEANWTATIPHGLPSNSFRPSFDQGSYLAFLGRLTAKRAPRTPSASRAAGMPLRIAAKIPRGETIYFKKQLEPHIDSRAFQLVGQVDEAKKQPSLAGAAALLFPIDWPAPFGLVMIEAMACGTPS